MTSWISITCLVLLAICISGAESGCPWCRRRRTAAAKPAGGGCPWCRRRRTAAAKPAGGGCPWCRRRRKPAAAAKPAAKAGSFWSGKQGKAAAAAVAKLKALTAPGKTAAAAKPCTGPGCGRRRRRKGGCRWCRRRRKAGAKPCTGAGCGRRRRRKGGCPWCRRRRKSTPAPKPKPNPSTGGGASGGLTALKPGKGSMPTLADPPFTPRGGKPTNAAETACFKKHNYYRRIHGMPDLKWDSFLRDNSEKWAQYITTLDQLKHTPRQQGKLSLGENLAMNSRSANAGANAVEMWYMEICLYKKPEFTSGTGHYTQVIWKSSQYVGCSVVKGPNGVFTVAQYYPPGNFMRRFTENTGDPRKDPATKAQYKKLCNKN